MADRIISDFTSIAALQAGDLLLLERGASYYNIDASNLVAHLTSDNIPEGATNKYQNNENIDDRVSALIQNGSGVTWTYDDGAGTLTGDIFDDNNAATGENNRLMAVARGTLTKTSIDLLFSSPTALTPIAGKDEYFIPIYFAARWNDVAGTASAAGTLDIVDQGTSQVLGDVTAADIIGVNGAIAYFQFKNSPDWAYDLTQVQIKLSGANPTGVGASDTLQWELGYRVVTFAAPE